MRGVMALKRGNSPSQQLRDRQTSWLCAIKVCTLEIPGTPNVRLSARLRARGMDLHFAAINELPSDVLSHILQSCTATQQRLVCSSFDQAVLQSTTKLHAPILCDDLPVQLIQKCPSLLELGLGRLNCSIDRCELDLSCLARHHRLEKLDLGSLGNRVGDASLRSLSMCRALAQLDISFTHVADLHPLASCPQLAHLSIAHTRVPTLDAVAGLVALKSLDCKDNPQLFHVRNALAPLVKCPLLERVTCSCAIDGIERNASEYIHHDTIVLEQFPPYRVYFKTQLITFTHRMLPNVVFDVDSNVIAPKSLFWFG